MAGPPEPDPLGGSQEIAPKESGLTFLNCPGSLTSRPSSLDAACHRARVPDKPHRPSKDKLKSMAEEGPPVSASIPKPPVFPGFLFRGDTRRSLTPCQALATLRNSRGAAQSVSPEAT